MTRTILHNHHRIAPRTFRTHRTSARRYSDIVCATCMNSQISGTAHSLNCSSRTPIPYSRFRQRYIYYFPNCFVSFYRSKYRSYSHEYGCNVPNIFISPV